jgi:hypothetical protein
MTDPERDSEAIEQLRRYANHLRGQVDEQAAFIAARRAMSARIRRDPRRRWVVGLAVAGLMGLSSVGLAAVADGAVPGDFLYPLDRGFEWLSDVVGTEDHTDERISEAEALAARGAPGAALEHLSESLGNLVGLDPASGIDVNAALDQARLAVAGQTDNQSQVQGEVDDLVQATKEVADAARAGDQEALRAAIAAMRDFAERVKDAASSGAPDQTGIEESPEATAPGLGRDNNPGVTAPGRDQGDNGAERGQGQ